MSTPAPAPALELSQNAITGRIILKESGIGIPNLLVVVFSPPPVILLEGTPSPDVSGDRLGSVITGPDGSAGAAPGSSPHRFRSGRTGSGTGRACPLLLHPATAERCPHGAVHHTADHRPA